MKFKVLKSFVGKKSDHFEGDTVNLDEKSDLYLITELVNNKFIKEVEVTKKEEKEAA